MLLNRELHKRTSILGEMVYSGAEIAVRKDGRANRAATEVEHPGAMTAVIVYSKLGPYHLSRLEATGLLGQEKGRRLVGIEISDSQSDYQWPDTPGRGQAFDRITLFPGRDWAKVPALRIRRRLQGCLNELRPDVVALPGWSVNPALTGVEWCGRHKVPAVLLTDSQRIDRPQTVFRLAAKRFVVSRYQAAFAGGSAHISFLEELGMERSRCVVGCDVIDNEFFDQGSRDFRQSRGKPGQPLRLLSCLRFLPRKNIPMVLEVLATRARQWIWTLAGDGPERPYIEKRIDELGLRDRVQLAGYVNYFQLPRLYGEADAYLQPSLSEPWGLAVNEAMACRLPVLVSDRCGCHPDLVRDGVNGFVFDPADPDSLGEALTRLTGLREQWEAMGLASRTIIKNWGLDLFARNFWEACEIARSQAPAARLRSQSV